MWEGGLDEIGYVVLTPPKRGFSRTPWRRRQRSWQFAVVAIQIEPSSERSRHELSKFTDPVAARPLAAWLRRITASNGFEVLGRTTGHIEHVGVGRAYLEGALLASL